ncbi:MAG: cob(I)alamin adenolsyltransferase [Desulfobacteraceae bacterium]|nr:MAG: cob(I)alamin adenolsyltransferase [Desulfobacteraceae bacterium]
MEQRVNSRSRILLFTGDGKGKTTAALGMVLRVLGHGMRAAVFQFVKGGGKTGELTALNRMDSALIAQTGRGFVPDATDPEFGTHAEAARKGLADAADAMTSGQWDLVVLDEINIAVSKALVAEAEVIAAVRAAAPCTVVVLTGRGATQGLMALADTITEMKAVRHGLSNGWAAQQGVEF